MLGELARIGAGGSNKFARFRCVTALAREGRLRGTFEGIVEGTIVVQPRGTGGFGYDPIFYFPEYHKTMAELPMDVKNKISHRARAAEKARAILEKLSAPPR